MDRSGTGQNDKYTVQNVNLIHGDKAKIDSFKNENWD
jgi:hypothetical protein